MKEQQKNSVINNMLIQFIFLIGMIVFLTAFEWYSYKYSNSERALQRENIQLNDSLQQNIPAKETGFSFKKSAGDIEHCCMVMYVK